MMSVARARSRASARIDQWARSRYMPHEREHRNPSRAIEHKQGGWIRNDAPPVHVPVGPEADQGGQDEGRGSEKPVGEHEGGAEGSAVTTNHCARSLGGVVRPRNGTEDLPTQRGSSEPVDCYRPNCW